MKNRYFFKKSGTILIIALFLVFFTFTIFSISYVYIKTTAKNSQTSDLYNISTIYEIYLIQLIDAVNKNVYDTKNYQNLLFSLKFFSLNYQHYNYQKNINEEIEGLTNITGNAGNPIKEIEITNIDQTQKTTKIIIRDEDRNEKNIEVNLTQFFLYRENFNNSFFIKNDNYLKEECYNYVNYLLKNTLESFANYLKKNKILTTFKTNKEEYIVRKNEGSTEVYAPLSIEYTLLNSKERVLKDYILYIEFQPKYVIFVSAFVDNNTENRYYSLYATGALEIKKLHLK